MNNGEIAGFSWRAPRRARGGSLRDLAFALAIVLAASLLCRLGAAYWPARLGGVHRFVVPTAPALPRLANKYEDHIRAPAE